MPQNRPSSTVLRHSARDGSLAGVTRLRDLAEWTGGEIESIWEGLTIIEICDIYDKTAAADYDWPSGWMADDPEGFRKAFQAVRWRSWLNRVLPAGEDGNGG